MSQFKIHSIQTAPAIAQPLLEGSLKKYGFVPNLHGGLAEAPAALKSYIELTALFDQTSFSPTEQQVILLAISVENHCTYCVAAHSMIAKHMAKADPAIVEALRNGKPLSDAKLDALASFSRAVVKNRGVVCGQTLDKFITAGYSRAQVLEVLLGVAFKTLSNYTNHIIHAPLDTAFQAEAWEEPAQCSSRQCA
ncbi:carboxymuconolactone decarboxylase family protein [Methylomonas sp. LW13]|uniref:carboxymuconolactone decarboxylase family protein n=1 Tax=unclassified Methylomonas TaxID=2608980 RepID=UPI00051AF6C6|nr:MULTISPECIES: carboxymuconolactone decarboxylase family protein [unclassified Methylomonas]PKD39494.1 carboxymuconolactone decarboxylase family protein [Methylomonas sp. Kb3]QBC27762.1 carboxymuconolactone decarboxylase family protein [Methylomonas sp. LW13]